MVVSFFMPIKFKFNGYKPGMLKASKNPNASSQPMQPVERSDKLRQLKGLNVSTSSSVVNIHI